MFAIILTKGNTICSTNAKVFHRCNTINMISWIASVVSEVIRCAELHRNDLVRGSGQSEKNHQSKEAAVIKHCFAPHKVCEK